MRVGIVLSRPPGYSETFFSSKIKGLQDNGVEVFLYCQSKKVDFGLCPIIESPKVSRNPLLQAWYFLKEFLILLLYLKTVLRFMNLEHKEGNGIISIFKKIYLNAHLLKAKLDWLHFGFATTALGSETVAKSIGAKMAVSFRGFDMAVYPVKNPGCYKTLWKYVDKIHTISDYLLDLASSNGLPKHIPYKKITPAVDINSFQPLPLNSSPSTTLVFVSTARLHWIKGLIHTIEALSILKNKGFDFTYRIIGEGKECERIAFAAYQLGLKNEVQFLGKLPHGEVRKELESATIYLQYSIQEGFCNAVIEAQAIGKLCIVSSAEGLAENVLHEETGWIVPKNSPNLLAEQIRNVFLMDNEGKSIISQNAIERVRTEFNLKKQTQEFFEFYR